MYEFLPPQVVAMTPDRKLMWNSQYVPTLGATVLRSPACSDELYSQVQADLSLGGHPETHQQHMREGTDGVMTIAQVSGIPIAVKRSKPRENQSSSDLRNGLSALRANVAVSEGLQRLAIDNSNMFFARTVGLRVPPIRSFDLIMPEYFAAVVYDKPSGPQTNTWYMSYEQGSESRRALGAMPHISIVHEILQSACEAVGLDQKSIKFDDLGFRNYLIRTAWPNPFHSTIVKIDNIAQTRLDF